MHSAVVQVNAVILRAPKTLKMAVDVVSLTLTLTVAGKIVFAEPHGQIGQRRSPFL